MCYNNYICSKDNFIISKGAVVLKAHLGLLVRLTAVVVCAAMMFAFGACKQESANNTATTKITEAPTTVKTDMGQGELYVYYSAADSLNPYEALTGGNQQISSLMFDPLVRLDPNLNPELKIAKQIEIDGKTVTITLKDVVFSDGSSVTAEDVTYSLSLAKKAKNKVYTDRLKVIKSYNAVSANTVELRLNRYDPLIANVLDFPIIKQGSTKRKNDDDKDLPPIGCGRYVYSDNSGTCVLSGNKKYYGSVPQNTVTLDNTPDKDALQYSIKAGEVDIYYSGVMSGNLLSMSGKTNMVKQPNIVFLGVNKNGVLKNKFIRSAVSESINRSEICKTAYYNYSSPAVSLFSDKMDIIKNCKNIFSTTAENDIAKAFLKKAGYSSQDSSGFYINSSKSKITLDLLYNSANSYQKNAAELIQKQLKSGGIDANLVGKSYNDYVTAVLHRNYDIYLGEIKLTSDFDFSALFSGEVVSGKTQERTTTTRATTTAKPTTTAVQTETNERGSTVIRTYTTQTTAKPTTTNPGFKNSDIAGAYQKFLKGTLKIDKFLDQFSSELPFIPIAYRYGVVSYNASISPAAVATFSDAYYNIEYLSLKK